MIIFILKYLTEDLITDLIHYNLEIQTQLIPCFLVVFLCVFGLFWCFVLQMRENLKHLIANVASEKGRGCCGELFNVTVTVLY